MKKKLIVVGAVVLGAMLVVAAVSDPSRDQDFATLRGLRPKDTHVPSHEGAIPRTETRIYSLHMSYDEAVKAFDKDVPKTWQRLATFGNCVYYSPFPDNQSVNIERGRLVDGVKEVPLTGAMARIIKRWPVMPVTPEPGPDPHGWVTVTTTRRIGFVSGIVGEIRELLRHRSANYFESYCEIQPQSKNAASTSAVDVYRGTMDQEGTQNVTRVFPIEK